MTPLEFGINASAYVAVALILGAVVATTLAFIRAQTMLLQAAFVVNKNPHGHLHPYTRSLLNGTCPELRAAQSALAHGDVAEARELVEEICMLLDAESDKSMRTQLQRKLKKTVSAHRAEYASPAPRKEYATEPAIVYLPRTR